MKSRGRKPKIYPIENLTKLIETFFKENPQIQLIKYKEIHLFALDQYNKGLLDFKLSEDFWRKQDRQGKILVDEINKKRNAKLEIATNHIEIVSTSNVIERLSKDTPAIKKLMANQLKVNEFGYRKLSNHYNQLKSKESQLEKEILELKAEIATLKKNNEIYQNVLFQWANISSNKDIGLVNLITTGKTRSSTVELLFRDMFSEHPNKAILNLNNGSVIDNIVEIPTKSKNTLIEDLNL